eukprot:5383211-Alexandrium_andersonii.AAC.1
MEAGLAAVLGQKRKAKPQAGGSVQERKTRRPRRHFLAENIEPIPQESFAGGDGPNEPQWMEASVQPGPADGSIVQAVGGGGGADEGSLAADQHFTLRLRLVRFRWPGHPAALEAQLPLRPGRQVAARGPRTGG